MAATLRTNGAAMNTFARCVIGIFRPCPYRLKRLGQRNVPTAWFNLCWVGQGQALSFRYGKLIGVGEGRRREVNVFPSLNPTNSIQPNGNFASVAMWGGVFATKFIPFSRRSSRVARLVTGHSACAIGNFDDCRRPRPSRNESS